MKYLKFILFSFLVIFGTGSSFSQHYYRFKSEISIKDKLADGSYRLTIGEVYYDKIYKKIVYRLKFPRKETVVMQDTTIFIINSKNIIESSSRTVIIPEFTAFHLALNGKLSDYGLKPKSNEKSIYKIGKVEKTEKGILTTWIPADESLKKTFGNIKMLNVNKRLDAMIFYNPAGKIISQQYFKKYINNKGVEFPTEITMISVNEKGEKNIQLTTYKNVLIDQNTEDEIYRYKLPVIKSARSKK